MQVYIYVKEVLKESVVLKIVDRQLSVYFSTRWDYKKFAISCKEKCIYYSQNN